MQKISNEQYLRQFVRETDYNLYLLHFFAPSQNRIAISTLMGLHCELRSIPEKVQDPMMMLIRLQWWRDEIEKIQNGLGHADSPVLNALSFLRKHESQRNQTDPSVSWDDSILQDYFNRFDQSFRGEDVDIDEVFYKILTGTIDNARQKNHFIKKLMHHDKLEDKISFRALRLWLGI